MCEEVRPHELFSHTHTPLSGTFQTETTFNPFLNSSGFPSAAVMQT